MGPLLLLKENIPEHLLPFVAEQDPSLYTAIDHASWRYIMRVSKAYFAKHAHQKYLDGLVETGISTERIPLISAMDEKLSKFGWRAVPVVGFIPPAVFMEFLSLSILPIACDMRSIEHLSYTPAPDIVHEAAGHAPIVTDAAYADYLASYGEIARKVIFSAQDMAVYEAVRVLSDTKEDPLASAAAIDAAQQALDHALAAVDWVSEATQLARMGWWTFEYGLVGDLNDPKIYGAGLLSSVGESYHCLGATVKKLPFSIDCVGMSYDITRPQPQLYVTPDFETLGRVLEQLAGRMAFRIGGSEALERAKRAGTVTTTVLDSGMQISGKLVGIRWDGRGRAAYLQFEGPSQLARNDAELDGHGAEYHAQGYGTPLGELVAFGKSCTELTDGEITRLNGRFEFSSGVCVEGRVMKTLRRDGGVMVISFSECTVKLGDEVLFRPEWGVYDLACGSFVRSVFGGAADRARYLRAVGGFTQRPVSQKTNATEANRALALLYAQVRAERESGRPDSCVLAKIHDVLEREHPSDWLLRLELLEIAGPWDKQARSRLEQVASADSTKAELISRGLELLENKEE